MTATFCPTCGRQRTGAQFCGGCGRDFGGAEPGGGAAGATPVEQSTQTLTARPAGPFMAPRPGPPPPFEPAYQPPRERPGRSRALWMALALVVVLAAGGGTFALLKSTNKQQPDGAPALAARTTAPPSSSAASAHPTGPQASPTAPAPSTAPPAAVTSPPAVAPPKPTPPPRVVRIPAGAGAAAGPVEAVLTHYFQGINDRDYAEYASSETAQGQANEPQSAFDSGYATTTDSGMTVTALSQAGSGDLIATVTFTSRQSPSDSVDSSGCNDWTLYFYLVQNGAGYLIAPAPSGYESTYTDC